MGVLNVTPDSFSDGGDFLDRDAAVAHGLALRAAGADYVDVGGESSRPGAGRVDAAEECRRVLPVVRELVAAGVPVSVDTLRVAVAEAALNAGAVLVNDVSGGLAEPAMAKLVAHAGVPWVLTHWYPAAGHRDVVAEVAGELAARVDEVVAAGVDPELLVLDPGLGFAKTAEHNWALLARLPELVALGLPVLVGASRKSFLGLLLAAPDGTSRPVHQRETATAVISAWAARAGAWGVRVHDVWRSLDALATVDALMPERRSCVS
ncbi:dihydropteroate synthase [Amycolatopsis acidicola]|uniref:dihydropteroate synthase n=1 Tax=Amycolatopsis acidicola TaxID=2596893 RepID=A0A5N0VN10_9PSEU|nr:dihydropteroate synthase [Amycolatopsis acidicola]KAA9166182.1 dihydropteroate synthase [Amycolatopsis acidicola]